MSNSAVARKRILITGATGFIGGHLVESAHANGWDVYAGVRATSDLRKLDEMGVHLFPFDMTQPGELERGLAKAAESFGGFDYVVHCAGITKPKGSKEFFDGNATFSERFGKAVLATQPDLQRFVFISTIAALGPGDAFTFAPISETQEANPITIYGKSKLEGERRLQQINGLPLTIIRPAAVYGPRDRKFIERISGYFRSGFDFRLGSAAQKLSFVHVEDLCQVVVAACRYEGVNGAYNISDGRIYGQHELNEAIIDTLGVRTIRLRIPSKVLVSAGYLAHKVTSIFGRELHLSHDKMREVTALNWAIDITKAAKQLGYQPRYDLYNGISATLSGESREQLTDTSA